jgi:hypothetical protein
MAHYYKDRWMSDGSQWQLAARLGADLETGNLTGTLGTQFSDLPKWQPEGSTVSIWSTSLGFSLVTDL